MSLILQINFASTIPEDIQADYQVLKDLAYSWEKTLSSKAKIVHDDQFCSQKDIIGHLLALRNNQLAGACKLFKRKIINDEVLILGGIGGLFVRKEWQRQGIAKALIKEALKQLKKNQCGVVYLCTDIDRLGALYLPLGFVPLKQGHTYLGKSGKRYTEDDGMMAPGISQEKFAQILGDPQPLDLGVGNW